MAQIAYKSAGAGVATETSGAACSPASPATVDAGDILIIHAYFEGTTTAPDTPSGFTLLHGPVIVETTIGRHWIYGKVADGSEDGAANALGSQAVTTMRSGRCYSFSGRVSGAIAALVKGFASTTHATDPQMPTVTTTHAESLAVACVLQNDNNALAAATGETGGDWTEAVAEFVAALTPGLVLQLQTATITSPPGSISGGSVAATNDPSGVIGFEIAPAPAAQTLTCTAPVLTFTAPAAARVATRTLAATAPVLTFSAPAAVLAEGGGAQALVCGAPVLTFTAPAATRVAVARLVVGAPTMLFSAPSATAVPGGVTLVAGSPSLVLTAPMAALLSSVIAALRRGAQNRGRARARGVFR